MYTLIYTESGELKRFALPPGDSVVGRAATCDLIINDASLSRWHARFSVTDERCALADIGSRNGTFLNGDQVSEAELHDGDQLILGRVPIQLEYSVADRITLTEDPAIVDLPGTVLRPIASGIVAAQLETTVDAPRLLKLMSEIARTLVKTQPLSEVLDQVVDLAFETTRAERAYLLLYEEATGELVPRVVRRRDAADRTAVAISRTIIKRVLADRVAILASNAQLDPRLGMAASIHAQNIRSLMCAPLWNENEVIGILYVDTPRSQRFTTADLDLFTALSNYAAVAIAQARLGARVLEETRRRERLQRYHSPAVVGRILQTGVEADAPFLAQERDLTVLFADIVGFTARSEGMPPQQVAVLLNVYFARMTDIIFEQEGTLDKFIGDAILAVFGAPLDHPDHALRAVRTAQKMRLALAELNNERFDPPVEVRIAIHSGVAMAGDIGSPRRREYTVLGDVVNTASRLEANVALPGQIVITRSTYDRLNGEIAARSLGSVTLRGRAAQIEVFEVEA